MKYAFSSEVRKDLGKNASHRLRERGYVPAVIYGSNMNTLPLEINSKEVEDFTRNYGSGGLVGLNVGGVNYTVFVKEIQKDPVTGKIIHVDFQQASQNERINVSVPIILRGKSSVERGGSIIQQQLRDIEVECSARDIPKALEFDISQFKPGDILKVADMEFGQEISIIQDPQSIIASIAFAKDSIEESEE
ncbi:50S ribosomal protein L25 [Alkaliphilus sp. B6464]|uniref:50S ribosomal protein L25 n=1 Tax=Alkaliphilus sp. B6464 TaxID=2731219 RepID=UPI001BA9011F|nr:50S ribosomal protein L25 [Alkaliphilus sp. B6464]QUH19419.1 50S ribosomal protein L25 [Alkaliphilus sp. B6464]